METTQLQKPRQLPPTSLAFVICGLASLFYVYEFFLRVLPSAMTHELMSSFQIDARGLGILTSLFYYAYTPMQIPAGLLLDRFGPRRLMTVGILVAALGAWIFGNTHSLALAGAGRFLTGFASSYAFVGALLLASRWFPSRYFATFAGLVQLMGCLGAIAGQRPVAILVNHIGWRTTILWAALTGIVLTVLFGVIIRDYPTLSAETAEKSAS